MIRHPKRQARKISWIIVRWVNLSYFVVRLLSSNMNYSTNTILFLIRLVRSLKGLIAVLLETFSYISKYGLSITPSRADIQKHHGGKSLLNSGWICGSLSMAGVRIHTVDTCTTLMLEWWCYAVNTCSCINHTNPHQHLRDIICIWLQCIK